MGEKEQLTFKTRERKEKSVTLTHSQYPFNAKCPVDGTQLIESIGVDDYFVACPNCNRNYYTGAQSPKSICTQERIDEQYQREIKDKKEELEKLRKEFQQKEAGLCKTIEELENPFTQE